MSDADGDHAVPASDIRLATEGGASVVVLEGEHDLTTALRVRFCLDEAIESRRPIVLDVSATSFMDTSILHAFFTVAAQLKADGRPRLVFQCPRKLPIFRVFEVSGLATEASFLDNRAEAVAAAVAST